MIVTEHIASGASLSKLASIFQDSGIFVDAATITMDPFSPPESLQGTIRNLYYGEGDSRTGLIFYEKRVSGVIKRFDVSRKHVAHAVCDKSQDDFLEKKAARADMRYLAEKLAPLLDVEVET